ncbi:MAG: hypothetical protein ISS46_00500 [Candidatus Omnitrophica bacterium]|nr:hypothetical protein [Candidatus Omnitrophota bacterium]
MLEKINGIGFALFMVMIGTLLLVPKGTLPESTCQKSGSNQAQDNASQVCDLTPVDNSCFLL